MGLDLILYKKTSDNMTEEEFEKNELAYGRKTWVIADFFRRRCRSVDNDGYEYFVTEKAWDEFIEAINAIANKAFRHRLEEFIESEDYFFEDDDTPNDYLFFQEWLDMVLENFSSSYYLGLQWELAAVIRWFDANEKVKEAFNEGANVRLIVSY